MDIKNKVEIIIKAEATQEELNVLVQEIITTSNYIGLNLEIDSLESICKTCDVQVSIDKIINGNCSVCDNLLHHALPQNKPSNT